MFKDKVLDLSEILSEGLRLADQELAQQSSPSDDSSSKEHEDVWVDVTKEFGALCEPLALGELVHGSEFGLNEAMSALEMMCEKMDAGYAFARDPERILSVEDAIRRKKLKTADFTPTELIGIIDEIVACEVTWLKGNPLAQSLYICMYISQPTCTSCKELYAYCIATIKTMQVIQNIMMRADVYREEDIQLRQCTPGDRAAETTTQARSIALLDEAIQTTEDTQSALDSESDDYRTRIDQLNALKSRMLFRRKLLSLLIQVDATASEARMTTHNMANELLELVKSIEASVDMGMACSKENYMGFEPSLHFKQLTPAPAVDVNIVSRKEALEYFVSFFQRVIRMCDLTPAFSYVELRNFVNDFTTQDACILSRSILHTWIYHARKIYGTRDPATMFTEALQAFINPPYLCKKAAQCYPQCSAETLELIQLELSQFMNRLSKTLVDDLKASCENRARQHRKMAHFLRAVGPVQEEADMMDVRIYELLYGKNCPPDSTRFVHYIGTWVLYWKIEAMVRFLTLGFELELYQPHELAGVFWYLDNLYGWQLSTQGAGAEQARKAKVMIEETENKTASTDSTPAPVKTASTKKKSKSSKNNSQKAKAPTTETSADDAQLPVATLSTIFLEVRQALSRAFCLTFIGLRLMGRLTLPASYVENEMVRYERRFEPFYHIANPAPLDFIMFSEYLEARDVTKPAELFLSAAHWFKLTQELLTSIATRLSLSAAEEQERQAILRVCKVNAIVLKLVAAGHKHPQKPELDFTIHPMFPNFVLK